MKRISYAGLLACAITLLFLLPATSKAQCISRYVHNSSSCDVTVNIQLLDRSCANVCSTQNGVVIPPGGTYTIPCTGCGRICNINVQLALIGSVNPAVTTDFVSPKTFTPVCNASQFYYDTATLTFEIN